MPVPVTGILSPEAPYSCWARRCLVLAAVAGVEVVADVVGVVEVRRLHPPCLELTSLQRPSLPAAVAPWRSCYSILTPLLRLSGSDPYSVGSPFVFAPYWEPSSC